MKKVIITLTILLLAVTTSFSQDLNYQLFEAVKENNLQKVEELIDQDAYIGATEPWTNCTPLHYACGNKNGFNMVKLLIEEYPDINAKDGYNETPLHYACKNKNGLDIVKLLIENAVDMNAKGHYNETPLHNACKNKNGFKIVKLLKFRSCN